MEKEKKEKKNIPGIAYKVLNKKERANLNNAIVRIISINTTLDWKYPFKISEALGFIKGANMFP